MFIPKFPEYSNGCTGIEWIWHKFAKRRPFFAHCCDGHDLDYVFSQSPSDKLKADFLFLICLLKLGFKYLFVWLCALVPWFIYSVALVLALIFISLFILFSLCMYLAVNLLGWPFWLRARGQF